VASSLFFPHILLKILHSNAFKLYEIWYSQSGDYPDQEASSYLLKFIQFLLENTWPLIPKICNLHPCPALLHSRNCATYVLKVMCSLFDNTYVFWIWLTFEYNN
jgi:hypothetical protein